MLFNRVKLHRKSRDLINRSSSSEAIGEGGPPKEAVEHGLTPSVSKGLLKLPVSLTKKSSSEHLKELAAMENQNRKQRQNQQETSFTNAADIRSTPSSLLPSPSPSPAPTPLESPLPPRTDNKLKTIDTDTSSKLGAAYGEAVDDQNIMIKKPKRRGLMVLRREMSTTSSLIGSSCNELYVEDELFAFTSEVATPALEEPELCDISGSSSSLAEKSQQLPMPLPPQNPDNSNKEEAAETTQHNTAIPTSQNKLREYKLIHSMFAKKSRIDSSNK